MSTLQELLLSIATGGPIKRRVHRGNGIVHGPFASGLSERGTVMVEQRPGHHPGLWGELQTTIARLAKMSGSAGTPAKAAELPMPYHAKASKVAAQLGNAVTTWARLMAEENDHLTLSAITVPDAAQWLAAIPNLIAEHPAAGEMHGDIQRWVRAAERVVDRAPDRIYAGPCLEPLNEQDDPELCQGQLYAEAGVAFVCCRVCRTKHDVAVRQEWLSRTLDDQLVSAAEAAPVLSWLLGKKITGNNIAAWKRDGRVNAHAGRWPYRFGDLLALAREMKTRARRADVTALP